MFKEMIVGKKEIRVGDIVFSGSHKDVNSSVPYLITDSGKTSLHGHTWVKKLYFTLDMEVDKSMIEDFEDKKKVLRWVEQAKGGGQ